MNAVLYLIIRQYINRIKRIFKKPSSAILTVITVLFAVSGPILMLIAPNEFEGIGGKTGRELIVACTQLFIGITLLLSALSQQGGLFTYSEANILFTSPFTRKTILLYSTLQSLPASVLMSFFMCFYMPYLIGNAMTPVKLILSLIVTSILTFCVYIIYYYIYIQDIARPGLKKRLRKYAWALFAVVVMIYALIWLKNGRDFGKAAVTFFTSPIYNAVPLFGWAKWAVTALLDSNYVTGFLPAILLLMGASAFMARVYYSSDVDFYEKAQLDSIRIQKVVDGLRSGQDAASLSVRKVHRAKGDFRPGAAAIMSRQLIEMKKRGPLLTFKDFITGAIYVVIGLALGMDFWVVYIMTITSLMLNTVSENWNTELKKPYIYLIPENPVKKLIYAVLPGVIKTALSESVIVAVTAVIFGINAVDIVFYILLLVSYILLFTSAGVFTYKIMGAAMSIMVQMVLRILLVMLSAIPGGVLAIVLAAVGIEGTASLAVPLSLMNAACALILMVLSRRLLEQSEAAM